MVRPKLITTATKVTIVVISLMVMLFFLFSRWGEIVDRLFDLRVHLVGEASEFTLDVTWKLQASDQLVDVIEVSIDVFESTDVWVDTLEHGVSPLISLYV